ncbi:MAG TPA: archaeosortase/exosortase family protein [Leptospiraceae bacterium]|nr:archaeosortase/exosortase family protein [Leptospiraceae bacterium]HNM04990.1 archaeosortase/exosortase family protein [Leptospiraceae bacterium]HNN02754.1 archaeosortase/exosortase family protein [Leptospiraceae bacterium]HNO24545.1 archaeosortase/exosortase family protein [Leptospiraceae bacterium]
MISGYSFFHFYPLLFLPMFLKKTEEGTGLIKFAVPVLAALPLAAFGVHMNSIQIIYVFCIPLMNALLKCFSLELRTGGYFLLLLIPPLETGMFTYFIGMPLRLRLTEISCTLLTVFSECRNSGNSLVFRDMVFTVDQVCEGLKFLNISALTVCILERLAAASEMNRLNIFRTVIFTAGSFLWLPANLTRILVLVLSGRNAENVFLHNSAGIFIYSVMILMPLLFFFLIFLGENKVRLELSLPGFPERGKVLLPVLALTVLPFVPSAGTKKMKPWPDSFFGYSRTAGDRNQGTDEIAVAYSRNDAKLIVKRGLNPFRSGHPPRICWNASGFGMREERDEYIKGFGKVRKFILEKGDERYYSAYWYENKDAGYRNGKPDEFGWRFNSAVFGEKHLLFNITAVSEAVLEKRLQEFIQAEIIKIE